LLQCIFKATNMSSSLGCMTTCEPSCSLHFAKPNMSSSTNMSSSMVFMVYVIYVQWNVHPQSDGMSIHQGKVSFFRAKCEWNFHRSKTLIRDFLEIEWYKFQSHMTIRIQSWGIVGNSDRRTKHNKVSYLKFSVPFYS
jgi:hypothetical protein